MGKIVKDIEQGSDAWHLFRSAGIGGSDMPCLLMTSPYKTIDELLEEKITGENKFKGNYASARGQAMEPYARQIYNEAYSIETIQALAIYNRFYYIRCSLDGLSADGKFILEIKSPLRRQDLKDASDGAPPPMKYVPQIMTNLLCSGAEFCDYATYGGRDDLYVIRVWPHKDWQNEIILRSRWFWHKVKNKKQINPREKLALEHRRDKLIKEALIISDNFRILKTPEPF